MELKAENVKSVFFDSLFKEGEESEHSRAVLAEGIMNKVGFHPERLEGHRAEVLSMLSELPQSFFKSAGGGMSFLQLPFKADGTHWAEHPTCEMLVLLALALKAADYCAPRHLWGVMPGGMPYIVVEDPVPSAINCTLH